MRANLPDNAMGMDKELSSDDPRLCDNCDSMWLCYLKHTNEHLCVSCLEEKYLDTIENFLEEHGGLKLHSLEWKVYKNGELSYVTVDTEEFSFLLNYEFLNKIDSINKGE